MLFHLQNCNFVVLLLLLIILATTKCLYLKNSALFVADKQRLHSEFCMLLIPGQLLGKEGICCTFYCLLQIDRHSELGAVLLH